MMANAIIREPRLPSPEFPRPVQRYDCPGTDVSDTLEVEQLHLTQAEVAEWWLAGYQGPVCVSDA